MKVLIVAKTHMRTTACVGGLALDENRNVRLLLSNGANPPPDTAYQVGDIWDLGFRPKRYTVAPHVEDVEVHSGHRIGSQVDLLDFLLSRTRPWQGGPEHLFDGLIRSTCHGAGYISRDNALPSGSVGFWRPADDLWAEEHDGKIRYRGATALIPYVGYEQPMSLLPQGSLLRVSLARWWRPDNAPELEERCYLQLSGWYALRPVLPGPAPMKTGSIEEIRQHYNQAFAPWGAQEDEYLRKRVLEGAAIDDLVSEFGRPPDEIIPRIGKLGLNVGTNAPASPAPAVAKAGAETGSGSPSWWRQQRPRAGCVWTPEEDKALLQDVEAGLPLETVAKSLGRGTFSVEVRLHKLGQGSRLPK